MSLDISIKYNTPKEENYGDTHRFTTGGGMGYTTSINETWTSNITHNCSDMAKQIPIDETTTLYDYVWADHRENTNRMRGVLEKGITYMINNREYLEQWNPENGWGSYDIFLGWLLDYWKACVSNPGCEVCISK